MFQPSSSAHVHIHIHLHICKHIHIYIHHNLHIQRNNIQYESMEVVTELNDMSFSSLVCAFHNVSAQADLYIYKIYICGVDAGLSAE